MLLLNIISISLIAVIALPFILFAVTRQPFFAALAISNLAVDISTKIIKRLTAHISPRPKGACACDILCRGPLVEGRPGFPSGHAAVSTFAGIALSWYYQQYTIWPYALAYVALTAFARIGKKCHTIIQVVAGIAFGALCATLFIIASQKYTYTTSHQSII